MSGSFCPWCGVKVSDGFAFCRACGKQLPLEKIPPQAIDSTATPSTAPSAVVSSSLASSETNSPAPRRGTVLLAILAIVVIAVVILGILAASGDFSQQSGGLPQSNTPPVSSGPQYASTTVIYDNSDWDVIYTTVGSDLSPYGYRFVWFNVTATNGTLSGQVYIDFPGTGYTGNATVALFAASAFSECWDGGVEWNCIPIAYWETAGPSPESAPSTFSQNLGQGGFIIVMQATYTAPTGNCDVSCSLSPAQIWWTEPVLLIQAT
jgi:hypothetical protein